MNGYYHRWIVRRDLPDIARIESDCFGDEALSESFLLALLKQRNMIGIAQVGIEDDIPIGYMFYELHRSYFNLVSIAVDEMHQGKGIGASLVKILEAKLTVEYRSRIVTLVCERNDTAIAFFKALGFRGSLVKQPFMENDDDGIQFVRTFADCLTESLVSGSQEAVSDAMQRKP